MNRDRIIILCEASIFNPGSVQPFPNLNVEYSVYLNSLLISNWIEILEEKFTNYEISVLLSKADEEFITGNLIPSAFRLIFYNDLKSNEFWDEVLKETINKNLKILLLYFNTIGLRGQDILRSFNLVNQDEISISVAKSNRNKLIFNCSTASETGIIDSFINANRDYDNYLNLISERDLFIHTLNGFLSIDDFEDIKKLYIELSKKESLAYCSQKMHESFNDLFIEYKELLNV